MKINFYTCKIQMLKTIFKQTAPYNIKKKKKKNKNPHTQRRRGRKYLGTGVAAAYNPVTLLLSGGLEFAAACLHLLYIV